MKKMNINEISEREIEFDHPESKSSHSFIGVYDIGDVETCKRLIQLQADSLEKGDHEGFNVEKTEKNKSMRNDDAGFFKNDYNEDIEKLNLWLQTAFDIYTKKYEFSVQVTSEVVKIHKVTPFEGGYHVWHSEQGNGHGYNNRVLTWIIYLNETTEGEGETEFLYQGLKVTPKPGRVVIWPAAFTHLHRGNPVYSSEKVYATGWFNTYEQQYQ